MPAFIHDAPADLAQAIERAALILRDSRHPLIAGLGTDIAGARVAVRLAARLRGALDHSASDILLRDVRTLQDTGAMFIPPVEARRADVLLGVGPGAFQSDRFSNLALLPFEGVETRRELIWLCPAGGASEVGMTQAALQIGEDPAELPILIGLLRAGIKGKRTAKTVHDEALATAVARLKAARYGVAVFDPADLDALAIENLNGLVRVLNAKTRFTTLHHPGPDNASGVNEVVTWLAGHPVRIGFGRGFPEHDPWCFEAGRLVESGEVDTALWISTILPALPAWAGKIPTIAIVGPGVARAGSEVLIEVGTPAVDHDAVLFSARTGALAEFRATEGSDRPAAVDILLNIEARLGEGEP